MPIRNCSARGQSRFISRHVVLILAGVLGGSAFMLSGCSSSSKKHDDAPQSQAIQRDEVTTMDAFTVRAPLEASVEAGVVRSSTFYEYHFVDGRSKLTRLGERDLRILARHFRGDEWILSVRQGDAPDDLYVARCAIILERAGSFGVAEDSLQIVDAAPGGRGVTAENARRLAAQARDRSSDSTAKKSSGGSNAPLGGE